MSEIFPFAQLAFFLLQILIIASLLLFFFRIRSVFGLGLLYVSLGVFQLLQVVFSLAIHVEILPGLVISPGSAVLFTGSLFAVLIVYIQEDAVEVRKIIYALLVTNLLISALLFLFGLNLDSPEVQNLYNLPKDILTQNIRFLVVGTLVLALDAVLLIVAYEYISRYISAFFFRIFTTMVLVLSFDTLLFVTGSFIESPDYGSLLMSGLAGKAISVFIYSMIVYFYFRVFERSQKIQNQFIGRFEDIFYFLTYRQKYEKAASNYRHILDNSSDVILIFEPNHLTLLEANAIAYATYGYARDEFIGMGFNKLMKDATRCESEIRGILETGLDRSFETVHVNRTGEEIPFRIKLSIVDYNGQRAVLCVSRNIAEQIKARDTLQESEHRFFNTLENIHLVAVSLDLNGNVTYCNNFLLQLTGFTREEVIGKNWFLIFVPESLPEVKEVFLEGLRIGNIVPVYENPIRLKDGTEHFIRFSNTLMRNAVGQVVGTTSIGEDITERKRVEEELQYSERRHSLLFEHFREAVAYHKVLFENGRAVDYVYLDVNEAFYTLTGLNKVIGKKVSEIVPDIHETNPELIERFGRVALTGKVEQYETHVKALDTWYYTSLYRLDKDIIVSVFDNITERKRADQALMENETRFRSVFENSIDAIGVSRLGNHVFVNSAYLGLFGYSRIEELAGKPIIDLIAPSERAKILEGVQRRAKGEHVPTAYETRGLRKDGSEFDMDVHVSQYELRGEKFTLVILRDITERKRADQALRESEEKFRRAVVDAPFPIILHAEDGEVIQISRSWIEITGYEEDELKTIADWTELAYGERKELVMADIDRLFKLDHKVYEGEYRIRIKNGESRIWEFSSAPLGRLVDGRRMVISMAMDITDRKQAEIMLIESEHRYQTLATISPVGIFRTDASGSTIYVNPAWCNIAGLSAEDALGDGWIHAIHPADKNDLIKGWQETTKLQKESFSEYRFLRQDGTIAWVMGQAVPEINPENQIVGYVGTITDITERKQAEQALQESEENYRQVFENVRDVLYTISPEGLLESINPAFEELTGWSVKEWLGKPFAALVHPDDLPLAAKAFQTVMSGGKIPIYELRILKKSGEYLVGEFSPSALGHGEQITATLGVARDITDRKQTEIVLQDASKRLAEAQKIAHLGFINWDIVTGEMYMSEEAYRIHGIPPGKDVPVFDFVVNAVHPDDSEYVKKNVELAIQGVKPYDIDHRILRADGKVAWVHVQGELIRDPGGIPQSLLTTIHDITDRVQKEEEIRKLNADLEQRVLERTAQLENANKELEEINDLFVGREMRIIELKEGIEKLKNELNS